MTETVTASMQDLFGVALPVIQAPMAGVQGSALAMAVANAGGLGSLPCAMLSAQAIREETARIRAQTDRPFNLNFFCHVPEPSGLQIEARWRAELSRYYLELGIDAAGEPARAAGRAPFTAALAEALADLRPPIVSFHFGLPAEAVLRRVRGWGAKVLASATTVDEARWLEARGVDAIIAQGWEAGGHRGHFLSPDLTQQAGTLALVPRIVHAVRVPVIAAGGIADAGGVAAALALGAVAAQVGTAYLLCAQATTSAVHRAALKGADAGHTAVTNLFSGRPARGIVNRIMRELGPLNAAAPPFPHASAALAPLRAKAEALGSGDFSPLWAGQNTTGCAEIDAGALTRALAGL